MMSRKAEPCTMNEPCRVEGRLSFETVRGFKASPFRSHPLLSFKIESTDT